MIPPKPGEGSSSSGSRAGEKPLGPLASPISLRGGSSDSPRLGTSFLGLQATPAQQDSSPEEEVQEERALKEFSIQKRDPYEGKNVVHNTLPCEVLVKARKGQKSLLSEADGFEDLYFSTGELPAEVDGTLALKPEQFVWAPDWVKWSFTIREKVNSP